MLRTTTKDWSHWHDMATKHARLFGGNCPTAVLRHQRHTRVVRWPSCRGNPNPRWHCYAHFTKAATGASVALKPYDWTGFAAKPGVAAYGVAGTPRVLRLKDADGNQFRDEMDPRELLIFMAWYMPDGGLVVDVCCGTGTTAMASLRNNVTAILIDNEENPLMLKLAWRRIEQYYCFLKSQGLLSKSGTGCEKPRPWEVAGESWQRKWGVKLRLLRKSTVKKLRRSVVNDARKLDLLKAAGEAYVMQASRRTGLPSGLPVTNYTEDDVRPELNDLQFFETRLALGFAIRKINDEIGLTVFTTNKYNQGDDILMFLGDILVGPDMRSSKLIQVLKLNARVDDGDGDIVFRAHPRCVAGMVNDGKENDLAKRSNGRVNCVIREVGNSGKLILEAAEDIDPGVDGVELFLDYGDFDYWRKKNHCWFPPATRTTTPTWSSATVVAPLLTKSVLRWTTSLRQPSSRSASSVNLYRCWGCGNRRRRRKRRRQQRRKLRRRNFNNATLR